MSAKSILFLEDDRLVSDMYSRALKNAGFNVKVVPNGRDGLQEAREKDYDIMLLDLMLPGKSGIEIVKLLRSKKSETQSKIHLIILTNLAQDHKARVALEKQVDGYLIKAETTPKKLIQKIRALK